MIHEVTSPQAFTGLRRRGLKVRRPGRTVATMDHSIPTPDPALPMLDEMAATQIQYLESNCREFGIPLLGPRSQSSPSLPSTMPSPQKWACLQASVQALVLGVGV